MRLSPAETAKYMTLADHIDGKPVNGPICAPSPAPKPRLLAEGFTEPATWMVPLHLVAGDNVAGKDRYRKIGRAGHERTTVHRTMAKQYAALLPFVEAIHAGKRVRVRLTRLGPRVMDLMNAIASLKRVQDAVAERFGVDDGSLLYDWVYGQTTAPAFGVRIDVEMAEIRSLSVPFEAPL